MNHFDEMNALLYIEGELDNERAREISAHADSCAQCRELLHALKTEALWLREALVTEEEAVPARFAEGSEPSSIPWGWISALGFSAGGAYTLWSGFIEPWRAQAAQAGFTQGNLITMLFFSGAFWKGWDAMRSMLEFFAVTALGTVVIWLLRRHWQRFPAIAVIIGAIFCTLTFPFSASAAETRKGDPNYTLPAGEVVNTDLFVMGDHVRIDGEVNGDLFVFSQNVVVNGHVKGDIISFAEEFRLNGIVDGNLRGGGQTLALNGTIGKNVLVWAGNVNLDEKAVVGGTITLGGGNVELNGRVAGDLLGLGQHFDLNGSFERNAQIKAESVMIGPSAVIKGHLKIEGHEEPDVSKGAKLNGTPEFIKEKRGPERNYSSARFYWHQTLLWGASFVFGLVLLLLAPGFFFDTTSACKKGTQSIGFGVLFLFATPIAAIIVCCTIVGLGVGIATIILWLIAIYSAQVFVGTWLGEKILGDSVGIGPTLGRLALGLAILRIARLIPYIGSWIGFLVVIWGIGALALSLYKNMRPQLAPAAA
jgi:cytoskeletal protein CcmA (bactofilin family)